MDEGNTGRLVFSKTKWTDIRYRHRVRRLISKTRMFGRTQPLVEGAIYAITFSVPAPAELPEEFQALRDFGTNDASEVTFVLDDETKLLAALTTAQTTATRQLECRFTSKAT